MFVMRDCFVLISKVRACLLLVCVVGWVALSGCQPGPPLAVQVKMLDASQLKLLTGFDLALFKTSLDCSKITPTTYNSSSKEFTEARILNFNGNGVVSDNFADGDYVKGSSGSVSKIEKFIGYLGTSELLSQHASGLELHLYLLAVGGDPKKPLADGCQKVTLKRGETATVSMTLKSLE
jgi:hypothetical protein